MTSRAELDKLDKKDLIALARERFGKKLAKRNNRKTLIHTILRLAGVPVEEEDEDAPAASVRAEGHVTVTITRCPDSTGVHLNVNNRRFDLPPKKPVDVPGWIIPSLRDAANIDFIVE